MKKVLLLLLVLGLLFSQSFPQEILEADLVLIESIGDKENGEAYYSNSDGLILVWVGTNPMEYLEWAQYEKVYNENGWIKTSQNGLNYYYKCEESYGEMYCMMDSYNIGTYYMVDISIENGNKQDAINIGLTVGDQITGGLLGFLPCSLGLILVGLAAVGLVRN